MHEDVDKNKKTLKRGMMKEVQGNENKYITSCYRKPTSPLLKFKTSYVHCVDDFGPVQVYR